MEALAYFLLWAVAIFLMMRFGCGAHVMGHSHRRGDRRPSEAGHRELRWMAPETGVDPVCGKTVRTDRAKPSLHDGYVYYFCSRECRERFEAAPQSYIGPPERSGPQRLEHHHG